MSNRYQQFEKIDGSHPLQRVSEDVFIPYRVRNLKGGRVVFFNFDFACELGLIPKSHPQQMNNNLERKILETFALEIINEYDQINKVTYDQKDIRKNSYMATRYLQLQHPNKQGKTSGDGRSIWNGCVRSNGITWDISSCGTGATSLSPATHIKKKFFKTGDKEVSYGCGYSEVDEGLSDVFFSEVFHHNHIRTERILAVLGFRGGRAITVRAYPNLIRPSHLFSYVKQNDFENLKKMVDYHIDRQEKNGFWKNLPKTPNKRYQYFLDKQVEIFSHISSKFENEYIFCWLDWDGDNILMDGSIIDYGSVRQLGLFHDRYRYDDDDRFSTTINEQKTKARYLVQTFVQLVDFLMTGEKKNIKSFYNHSKLIEFDKKLVEKNMDDFLYRFGFDSKARSYLLKKSHKIVKKMQSYFYYFERFKGSNKLKRTMDGINQNPCFSMRNFLRELAHFYLISSRKLNFNEFMRVISTSFTRKSDMKPSLMKRKRVEKLQTHYLELLDCVAQKEKISREDLLEILDQRSSVINKAERVTGDAITIIIDKICSRKNRLDCDYLYLLLQEFKSHQVFIPEKYSSKESKDDYSKDFLQILEILSEYKESV